MYGLAQVGAAEVALAELAPLGDEATQIRVGEATADEPPPTPSLASEHPVGEILSHHRFGWFGARRFVPRRFDPLSRRRALARAVPRHALSSIPSIQSVRDRAATAGARPLPRRRARPADSSPTTERSRSLISAEDPIGRVVGVRARSAGSSKVSGTHGNLQDQPIESVRQQVEHTRGIRGPLQPPPHHQR